MLLPPSLPLKSRRSAAAILTLLVAVLATLVLAGSASAWTLNKAQLDNGTCGHNLQTGSDKTASASATPGFLLWGNGGSASYDIFIDGVFIGNFRTDPWANVCITTTVPLSDGPHLLTGRELTPNPLGTVIPFAFSVDTMPPPVPSAPVLATWSDSGIKGDAMTMWRNFTLVGTSAPLVSVQIYNGATGIGGAPSDSLGAWSASATVWADGPYFLQSAAFDTSGNKSALSSPYTLTVDTVPPTVSLTSPAAGASVAGTVDLTAAADDALGIWKVEFKVDGLLTSTDLTAPYSYAWSSSLVGNGTHTILAVASDRAGNMANASATVTVANGVATVPGAPTLNSATAGNGTVGLSWTTPTNGGSAITGYKIYRGTSSGGETLLTSTAVTTSFTDTTAANGTTYYYQVTATNAIGESLRSGERSATPVAPAGNPGAPTLNSATAGIGSVALAWSAPASDGGSPITGYKIYRGTTSGGATLLTTVANSTSWTDTTAQSGVTHYYQVSAVNFVGEGARSNERSAIPVAPATAPAAPTLNSATAGNGTVALSWTSNGDGGSAITWYRIYRGTSSGGEVLLATLGAATNSWTDTGVTNGTTYYYQVSAANSIGEGSRSNERSATPAAPLTVPGAPTLSAATAGNGTVGLSWTTPADGGSAITWYRIYRGTSSGGEVLLATLGAATNSWTDTGVTNGTTYYYQVSAANSIGEGSRSNERSATPAAPLTVPGAPTLSAATAGNGTVGLSWTTPADGGSAITWYRIYRGTSSGGEVLLATLGAAYNSWTDTGVTNGTTYYYQVSAANSIGEGSRSNERSATPAAPLTVPGAPTLSAATAGNGTVGLSWTTPADGGSAITWYRIYRGTSSGGEVLLATFGAATNSWTDTGVTNGTTYYYQVSAANSIGEGSRSNERSATPAAPLTVPGAPTLSAATAGNGTVGLSWTTPADGGSAITWYRIYRGTSSGGEVLLATLGAATNSWTDTGVTNGTTYYYQVSAANSIGEGSRSNERSATPAAPLTVPGAPTLSAATAGNGTVALAWSAPASNGGSAITGYKIYRGTSSGGETHFATVSGTSWTDTSAANGVTYYYQVAAVNSVGDSSRSNERSATPAAPLTVPGAPTLSAATAGNGTVALAWSAPASNGGSAITGYKVYRATSSGNETLYATVGTGTSFTDSSVANGVTYYYQVTAVNSVGEGARSNERSATPTAPTTAPAAPFLSSAVAGDANVELTWTTPSDGGSPITAYRIYRSTFSGGETLFTTVDTDTSWTDTSVANGQTYWYQVTAVNAVGDSIRSNERSAMPATVPAAPSLLSATPGNSVTLTWAAPAATGGLPITGYRVYRGTSSGNTTFLASVGAVTTYTDTTTDDGVTYWFQVSAITSAGEGQKSNELAATTFVPPPPSDTTPPSTPATLKDLLAGTTQIVIDWPASTDNVAVTGYRVYRNSVLVATVTTTYFLDSGLTPGATYAYFVRAIDAAGNTSGASASASTRAVSSATGTTGTLSGIAFDGNGTPLANVIASTRLPNGSLKTTKTNNTGLWKFTNFPAGAYTITFTLSGYVTKTVSITAVGGRTQLATVSMPRV